MLYGLMRGIAQLLLGLPRRVEYHGVENIPKEGPVLLISNHVQYSDPVLLAMVFKRPVHFLAKAELFEKPVLGWFFRHIKCIAIARQDFDRNAIREAIQVLKDGEILGIFPEGTRAKDGKMLPFKSGVCFIASQAPCQILPVGITYKGKTFDYFGEKIVVNIGKPFPYESIEGERRKETQQRMLEKQESAVANLLKDNSLCDV